MKPKNPQGGPDRPQKGGGGERQPAESGDVETGGQEREREAGPTGEEDKEEKEEVEE